MARLVSVSLVFLSTSASALMQPNGAQIPSNMGCAGNKPTGLLPAFACTCTQPGVCNIGAPCPSMTSCPNGQNGTCESTMWHAFNDNTCIPSQKSGLDPWAEAKTTPETFHPTCPLTFTVVTREDARFKDAFGWYNVTGQKPSPDDLHVMLDCNAGARAKAVLDVKSSPHYKGGEVGFFLVTPESHTQKTQCSGGDCCATVARLKAGEGYVYFSERKYNDDNTGPSAFIHLLVYDSHLAMRKFYFAWEDIWGGSNNTFTDLVTSVDGVECSGGGTTCNTGKLGACKDGVNTCDKGVLTCHAVHAPRAEKCDGLDDDCNGIVDDDAPCPAGEVCKNGVCVPHCTRASEFACPPHMSCEESSGRCVDPACAEVTCPSDQVCREGKCTGACDGIVCPVGTECRLGSCIAPCKHIECPMGEVCARGFCVAGCNQCGGLTCSAPAICDAATGGCKDPSCPQGCPAGTWCDAGTCKDACLGAKCPAGEVCEKGECVPIGKGDMPGDPNDPGGPGGSALDGCGGCAGARGERGRSNAMLFAALLFGGGLWRRRRH